MNTIKTPSFQLAVVCVQLCSRMCVQLVVMCVQLVVMCVQLVVMCVQLVVMCVQLVVVCVQLVVMCVQLIHSVVLIQVILVYVRFPTGDHMYT